MDVTNSTSGSGSGGTEQLASTSNKPLRSGYVPPAIRSAPQTARVRSAEEIASLRALPYEQYLLTPWWHSRRNAALKRARYRCERCAAGRELQVHHLRYERLGDEADEDLQVLCRGCHLGHHVDDIQNRLGLGVYFKVISETLRTQQFTSLSDLVEEVKCRCARADIPYDEGQIHRVLDRFQKDPRLAFRLRSPKYAELLDSARGNAPLTRAEAAGCMAKYGAIPKSMPSVPTFTRKQADSLVVVRQIVQLIAQLKIDHQIARCAEAERIAEAEKAKPSEDYD